MVSGDTKANCRIRPKGVTNVLGSIAQPSATMSREGKKKPTDDPRYVAAVKLQGQRLRKARLARGLQIIALARETGLGENTLIRAENGRGALSAPYLLILAQHLKVEGGWLLGQKKKTDED